MGPFALAMAWLRDRPLTTAFNVCLFALGAMVATALLLVTTGIRDTLDRNNAGIDLVVGAKGSPLQIILSSIYHADVPTGNVDWSVYERLAADPMVAVAVPVGLGDAFRGYRIVGAPNSFAALYDATAAQGRLPSAPLEVTIGADIARVVGVKVGDEIVGAHGLGGGPGADHGDHAMKVVGIFAPTGSVLDRLLLTPIESVWMTHGYETGPKSQGAEDQAHGEDDHAHDVEGHDHQGAATVPGAAPPREATAILIKYATPMAMARLPMQINREEAAQAAVPAIEATRLLSALGVGFDILQAFGWALVAAAAAAVFVAALSSLRERRGDIALMRVMGASRGRVMVQVLLEAMLTALIGGMVGIAGGHALVWALGQTSDQAAAFSIGAVRFLPQEGLILLGALGIGALAALIPAIGAYRTDPATTLARSAG
jgi:putative ABC transport system permease protein